MKTEELFKKYRSRLNKEAILRSLAFGLLVGLSALAVSAFIVWMTGFKAYWISLVVFGGVSVTAFLLFYFLKFKPSDYYIARRVDALGLEERMVTMKETSIATVKSTNTVIRKVTAKTQISDF